MGDEYLDNCLTIEANDDAYNEKTRIAEVAATTLCKLNSIMKQMKDWRDDRLKLRSNIWRLKLALRVAGRETDDTLQADPLIEHQRTEIKRLEGTNQGLKKELADIKTALLDSGYITQGIAWKSDDKLVEVKRDYLVERERLNNEIQYLKSRLSEVEEGHEHSSEVEHLRCKLKHFMMVDHTMEIIFTDIVNKVAETIANLSEELVNMNERFHRSQLKNDSLHTEIDKLKAMLRFKCGNVMEYQKRTTELDNLTRRLKTELNKFKNNYDQNSNGIESNYKQDMRIVERLASDLKNKLQNDHEALLAAGDPDCLKYMQKIVEVRVILRQLHVRLGKLSKDPRSQDSEKIAEYKKQWKQFSILDSIFKEVTTEIDKLKDDHLKKHCRISGTDGLEYLNKIKELESIVEKARATMNGLSRRMEESSREWKNIEKLEGFVGRVCHEIKQLELIVSSSDCSSVFERVEQMEECIVRLKTESNEKDERIDALNQELFEIDGLLEQKIKDLNDAERKLSAIMEENKALKWKAKIIEEKSSELQREQEDSKKELEQLQQVQREVNMARKKLYNLQADKEGLLKEVGKVRDILQKRNEEFKTAIANKEATEKSLNAKIMDLSRNLQAAFKENEKLQGRITEHERSKFKEFGSAGAERARQTSERSKSLDMEVQRLRANLATSMESLDNANREIADLKSKLDRSSAEKARLDASVLQLESKKEDLVYQLGAEKTIGEGRLKDLAQLKSNYTELDIERMNLLKEREQLNRDFINLKHDRDLLQKSLNNIKSKNSELEDEVNKCRSENENLDKENRNFKESVETLSAQLKEARTELNSAGDKTRRLEFENSMLRDDLNGQTLKNISYEDHLQILRTEKNELATRIIEMDKENVHLKDRLNEIETINEHNSIEWNKLKTEHDETILKNTDLQMALDVAKKSSEELKETNEGLIQKLNEIRSEFRILENQLKILEMMNVTAKKDKEALEGEYRSLLKSNILKMEENRSVTCGGSTVQKNEQVKGVEDSKQDAKLSKGISDKTKEELKKLMAENESLRFEILNLRNQKLEVKKELSRTQNELQRQRMELAKDEGNENVTKPISSKLEIVNLYYKEINSYTSRCSENVGAVTRIDHSGIYSYDGSTMGQETGLDIERLFDILNRLKVENVALKMEVNSLRCNVCVNSTKDEQWRSRLLDATEELEALKVELAKLRDEKQSLRAQLETARTKLDRLESEKIALKDELYMLRQTNSDLKNKMNESRCDYQKLKEKKNGIENCFIETIKKIRKYTTSAETPDSSDVELRIVLRKYISNEEILSIVEEKINMEKT